MFITRPQGSLLDQTDRTMMSKFLFSVSFRSWCKRTLSGRQFGPFYIRTKKLTMCY